MSDKSDEIFGANLVFISAEEMAQVYRAAVFTDVPVVITVIGAPWLPEKLRQCIKQNPGISIDQESLQTIHQNTEMMPDFCFIFCETMAEAEKIKAEFLEPLLNSVSPELRSKVTVGIDEIVDESENKTPPAS